MDFNLFLCELSFFLVASSGAITNTIFVIRPEFYVINNISDRETTYSGFTVIDCARACLTSNSCAAISHNVSTCWLHVRQDGRSMTVPDTGRVYERCDNNKTSVESLDVSPSINYVVPN